MAGNILRKISFLAGQVVTAGAGVPVQHEPELEGFNGFTADLQVCVPPETEFFIQSEILVADLIAADVSDSYMADHSLPVVPVIHPGIDQRQHVGEKRFHLPPFILEFPEISQAEPPGTYVIVKYSYSDTFLLLLKQCVIEFSSEIVQFENIVLEMDVVF